LALKVSIMTVPRACANGANFGSVAVLPGAPLAALSS
jgi:hypothetical protein